MPLRIMVFRDDPTMLLVHVPEGESFALAGRGVVHQVEGPFTRAEVHKTFEAVGTPAYVQEADAGAWSSQLEDIHRAQRRARGSLHRAREAQQARLLRGSSTPEGLQRAELLTRRLAVDANIRRVKQTIREVGTRDQVVLRDLQRDLRVLQDESQELQVRMGELRRAEDAVERRSVESLEQAVREAVGVSAADIIFARAATIEIGKPDPRCVEIQGRGEGGHVTNCKCPHPARRT